MTPFSITSEPRDHALALLVRGDLDIATAPQLRAALEDARAAGTPRCVVDLTDCTFIDSTGTRTIAVEAEVFDAEGLTLALHCPTENRHVRFVVDMIGLPEVMTVTPPASPPGA